MTRNEGLLFAGVGAAILGGIVYITQRKKTSNGTAVRPPGANGQGLPAYVSDELVEAYTRCYEQGCSQAEYDQVQAALRDMANQHPEDADMWNMFSNELAKRSPTWWQQQQGTTNTSDPSLFPGIGVIPFDFSTVPPLPPLPGTLPINLSYDFQQCWGYFCPQEQFNSVLAGLDSFIAANAGNLQASMALTAKNALMQQRIRQTSGVVGRHTGGCSCEKRQQTIGTGACCAACERGEECEECENHAAVAVG
jgi:hypothetical protein